MEANGRIARTAGSEPAPPAEATVRDQETVVPQAIDPRVVPAGLIGSIVEYYDFGIYGYLATILSVVFFAGGTDPTGALLATFATFAAAFVLRPLGGLIFGHLGDRFGRSRILAATILSMCAATVAIGVLPTYSAIGVGAAFLLVAARCVQGVASGGEVGGAAAYVAEKSPPSRRGFLCSTVQLGALAGALLASIAVTILTSVLTHAELVSWGWRIPFLLSLPLGLVGLWIRFRLEDSVADDELASGGGLASAPAAELVRAHLPGLLRTLGLSTLLFAGYYVVYVYASTHLQRTGGFTASAAFWSTTTTLIVSCLAMPLFGHLADKWGRKPLLFGAAIAFGVLAVPGFALMNHHVYALALLAQVVLGLPESALMGVVFATFAEMFPSRVRYTGIALGFNLASMAVGGTAPLICLWLLDITGNALAPAWFLVATAVISAGTALTLTETRGTALRAG
ncbi:MFS transporter [Amycolatopsis acididurans]|uniref:MFS transporter n=1 Tax=Amycolatopsis acididurans TaxID=2724524 RepID=UPI001B331D12|nr:MFS transporter [Amycolatopsis acididurans]